MTRQHNEIKDKLYGFIAEQFPTEESPNDETLLFQEGYIDSVGLLSVIYFIEDNFKFNISDGDVVGENFESIKSITAFIERIIAQQAEGG